MNEEWFSDNKEKQQSDRATWGVNGSSCPCGEALHVGVWQKSKSVGMSSKWVWGNRKFTLATSPEGSSLVASGSSGASGDSIVIGSHVGIADDSIAVADPDAWGNRLAARVAYSSTVNDCKKQIERKESRFHEQKAEWLTCWTCNLVLSFFTTGALLIAALRFKDWYVDITWGQAFSSSASEKGHLTPFLQLGTVDNNPQSEE